MKKMEKGFTLVELMIVVAIIAILAAVAVPNLASSANKARDSKGLAVLGNARTNVSVAVADLGGSIPDTLTGDGVYAGGTLNSKSVTTDTTTVSAISGISVSGAAASRTATLTAGNFGTATSPTMDWEDSTDNSPLADGRNVVFTSGTDTKGRSWNSY